MHDVNRPLQHGYPRAFDSRIDREHSARDRDAAIGSLHVQVAGVALGGLHNDGAIVERDGHVTPSRAYSQHTSFVDLNRRSVPKTKNGVGSAACSQLFALIEYVPLRELTIARFGD